MIIHSNKTHTYIYVYKFIYILLMHLYRYINKYNPDLIENRVLFKHFSMICFLLVSSDMIDIKLSALY